MRKPCTPAGIVIYSKLKHEFFKTAEIHQSVDNLNVTLPVSYTIYSVLKTSPSMSFLNNLCLPAWFSHHTYFAV